MMMMMRRMMKIKNNPESDCNFCLFVSPDCSKMPTAGAVDAGWIPDEPARERTEVVQQCDLGSSC